MRGSASWPWPSRCRLPEVGNNAIAHAPASPRFSLSRVPSSRWKWLHLRAYRRLIDTWMREDKTRPSKKHYIPKRSRHTITSTTRPGLTLPTSSWRSSSAPGWSWHSQVSSSVTGAVPGWSAISRPMPYDPIKYDPQCPSNTTTLAHLSCPCQSLAKATNTGPSQPGTLRISNGANQFILRLANSDAERIHLQLMSTMRLP